MRDEINSQLLNPFLGNNPRETMHKVSAVLAFVSRSAETRLDISSHAGMSSALVDYHENELEGLTLVFQALIGALDYEPPPTTSYG